MRALTLCLGSVLLAASASAYAADSPEALDELKQGYALKQVGNCRDAVPHFARSAHLQSTGRAWLNLADCEQKLGELVAAQAHAAQGRELARQQNDTELVGVADEQIAAIDKRLPRLTIRLSAGAPPDTKVVRDGVPVDASSIGAPVAVNLGSHIVVASAKGRADRRFDVTVDEGGRREIEVDPGPKLGLEPPANPAAEAKADALEAPPSSDQASSGRGVPFKPLAVASFGVGAAGLAVGVIAGVIGASKHDALTNECPNNLCPPSATNAPGDLDAFHTLRTVSTVGYVVGVVGVAGGVVLWLTAPRSHPSTATARIELGPSSAFVAGSF